MKQINKTTVIAKLFALASLCMYAGILAGVFIDGAGVDMTCLGLGTCYLVFAVAYHQKSKVSARPALSESGR